MGRREGCGLGGAPRNTAFTEFNFYSHPASMAGKFDAASCANVGGPGGTAVVKEDQTQNGGSELVWPGHPMRTKDNGTALYMPV